MDKREIYDSFEKMEQQTRTVSEMLSKIKEELTQVLENSLQSCLWLCGFIRRNRLRSW